MTLRPTATGIVRASVPAGSAFIFDSNCWHCALPNVSGQARNSLLLIFAVPNELFPFEGSFAAPATRQNQRGTGAGTYILAQELGLSAALLRLLKPPPVYEDPFAGGIVSHGR